MDASGKIDTPIVTALKEQETAFKDEHCVGLSQKDCAGAYANHQREQLQDIPIVGSVAAVGQCMNGNDAACKDIVVNVTTDVVTGVTGTVLIKVGGEVVKYSIGKLGDVVSDTYTLIQNKKGKGETPKFIPSPRTVENLQGGPLENATQVSGRFTLENGPVNGTLYRADNQGNITSYAKYDSAGRILKRVDVIGADHNDVPTPHVLEYGRNTLPDSSIRVQTPRKDPRPANQEEIP